MNASDLSTRERLRQEECEFKTSLDNIVKLCLTKTNNMLKMVILYILYLTTIERKMNACFLI